MALYLVAVAEGQRAGDVLQLAEPSVQPVGAGRGRQRAGVAQRTEQLQDGQHLLRHLPPNQKGLIGVSSEQ